MLFHLLGRRSINSFFKQWYHALHVFWYEKPSNPSYQSTWGILNMQLLNSNREITSTTAQSLMTRSIVREKSQSVNLRGHLNQDAGKERNVIFQPQSIMEVEVCVPPTWVFLGKFSTKIMDSMGERRYLPSTKMFTWYTDIPLKINGWNPKSSRFGSDDGTLSKQVIFRFRCVNLPGGFNPSEKYYSIWIISPSRGENHKCLKPPASTFPGSPPFPFQPATPWRTSPATGIDHLLQRTLLYRYPLGN